MIYPPPAYLLYHQANVSLFLWTPMLCMNICARKPAGKFQFTAFLAQLLLVTLSCTSSINIEMFSHSALANLQSFDTQLLQNYL